MDEISKIGKSIIDAAWNISKLYPASVQYDIDKRNELECLKLYDEGWQADGFKHVPDTYEIITYWKKDGEERKAVTLTFEQQRRLVRELEKRTKEKKRESKRKK